ncbi:hypothetical protein GQ42DRAFT_120564 [Ramicandelaber brevisporus]|nr:hypothetical protein GQ42DRAFT_120564 [Ramicandelaber brevisporus]
MPVSRHGSETPTLHPGGSATPAGGGGGGGGGGGSVRLLQHQQHRHRRSVVKQIRSQRPERTHGVSLGPRVSASVTLVPSVNQVIVIGGFHQFTDEVFGDVHALNLDTNEWSALWRMRGARLPRLQGHSATLWGTDRIVVFGGSDEDDRTSNDVYIIHLSTVAIERIKGAGHIPRGRTKHAAVICEDVLYIVGGFEDDGTNASEMLSFDLHRGEWRSPVPFVFRHSHACFAFEHRLYVYGGFTAALDKAGGNSLAFIDLHTGRYTEAELATTSRSPNPGGTHFAQRCGDKLVVLIISGIQGLDHATPGLWALDLHSLLWRQYHTDAPSQRLIDALHGWHYYAMAEGTHEMLLFGNPLNDNDIMTSPDDYLGTLLTVNLHEYGLMEIPPPTLSGDLSHMLDSHLFSDFTVQPSPATEVAFPAHRVILAARWPHFLHLLDSGMCESSTSTIRMPEPPSTVQAFLRYIYSDAIGDDVPVSTVVELLVMAKMYMLPRLHALCCSILHDSIRVETVARIFEQANLAEDAGLRARCLRYMFDHYGSVTRTDGFRRMSRDALMTFWDATPHSSQISKE